MDLSKLNLTKPKVLGVRSHKASRIFTIEEVDLEFSNGVKAVYERLPSSRGAVMVVPFDGTYFYLSAEYAVGQERYELSFVKGKIDANEDPQDAALREMQEEIGYNAKKITLLKDKMTVAPGMLGLVMYVYLCEDLFPSKLVGDEPEDIAVIKVTVEEALSLIFEDDSPLKESRAIAALTLALHKIGKL